MEWRIVLFVQVQLYGAEEWREQVEKGAWQEVFTRNVKRVALNISTSCHLLWLNVFIDYIGKNYKADILPVYDNTTMYDLISDQFLNQTEHSVNCCVCWIINLSKWNEKDSWD